MDLQNASITDLQKVDNDDLWNRLKAHRSHKVTIATYGDWDNPNDICLECEDCNEVILDAGVYTTVQRDDFDDDE